MKIKLDFSLLLACFFLSGFAGLVYQTAWILEFSLVFGTTELALVTVLAAYMGGLALGAAIAGRLLHKMRRPILVYGLLELGIALAALAVPFAINLVGRLHGTLMAGQQLQSSSESAGTALLYLVTSFCILLVPTGLMGATLPLLARWAVRKTADIGPRIGVLYTANTAGAAAGTVVAAFWLLPWLSLEGAVWTAIGINVLVFFLAILLARGRSHDQRDVDVRDISSPTVKKWHWILPVMLVSGSVAFTWEVLWTRLLGHILGGSVHAFATMLGTFLIGIALGSGIASRLAKTQEQARITFAIAQFSFATFSLAAFFASDWLASFAKPISHEGSLIMGVLISGALLFPGALASGATFPLAVRLLARDAEGAALASARIFAWNTVGAIAGALVTGYFVLPMLRFAGTAIMAIILSIGLGLTASLLGVRYRRPLLGVATGVLLVLLISPPSTPWRILRHSPMMGAAVNQDSEVTYFGVGRSSTVMMTELPNQWRLTTNGLPESGIVKAWSRPGRFVVARWLSHLPLAARPDTRSLLVVGFGAGNTIDYLPDSIEEIHVIELESEVLRANRAVVERPTQPLDDPRVRLYINDARGALRLTERKFDAIVSQPSHPWTSGAANLFTREFFQLVHDRLEPNGVFVQWMGLTFIDGPLFKSLVATTASVFPHVEVYRPVPGVVLLLGSASPIDILATAPLALDAAPEQWSELGILEPEDLIAAQALNSNGSQALAKDVDLISDRQNTFRHGSPQALRNPLLAAGASRLLNAFEPLLEPTLAGNHYLIRRLIRQGELQRAKTLVQSLPANEAHAYLGIWQMAIGRSREAEAYLRRGLTRNADDVEARAALLQLYRAQIAQSGIVPSVLGSLNPPEKAVVDGWRLASIGDWVGVSQTESVLAGIEPKHPLFQEASRLRANWRAASGDPKLALQALSILNPLLAPSPRPRDLLIRARAASSAGKTRSALASIEEALSFGGAPSLQRSLAYQAESILNSLIDSEPDEDWKRSLQARVDGILQRNGSGTR